MIRAVIDASLRDKFQVISATLIIMRLHETRLRNIATLTAMTITGIFIVVVGWSELERDGITVWDGIRNATAQRHLRACAEGDQALMSAIPRLEDDRPQHIRLQGEVPTPVNLPSGCVFHGRCPHANARCRSEIPQLIATDDGSQVACHAVEEGRID